MTLLPDPNIVKKAYSAGYAGFRVAKSVSNPELRMAIEKYSLSILLAAVDPNAADLVRQTRKLEYVIGFGRDVGDIHPQTAELLLAELNKMPEMPTVAESGKEALSKEEMFPDWSSDLSSAVQKSQPTSSASVTGRNQSPVANGNHESSESFNSRKEKILVRIRQSGNCRMKDIQEVMPEISERTLRYDLQRLVAEQIIERVGQSGPATYYRLKAGA